MMDSGNIELEAKFYDLHEPLGALIVEFSELEAQVTKTINSLLQISYPEGVIMESLMANFSLRIEMFHALGLLHSHHDTLSKEADKIAVLLHSVNAKRNDLIHNEWTSVLEDSSAFGKVRHKTSGGKIRQSEKMSDVTVSGIWDVVDEVFLTKCLLERWIKCLRNKHPDAWPPAIGTSPRPKGPRRIACEKNSGGHNGR